MVERGAREMFWADDSTDIDATWDAISEQRRETYRAATRAVLGAVAWDVARVAWNLGYHAAIDQVWGEPPAPPPTPSGTE